LKKAVSYSLPSFSLGFCGPQDKISRKILFDFAQGKNVSEDKVKNILSKFEAAYSYYKLIAQKNKIKDPLDEKVVEAFWVGNRLLEKISDSDLKKLILTQFSRPGLLTKEEAQKRAIRVSKGATAHHSFHVLVLGAIAGRVKLEGELLDLCRIGWGKVTKIISNKLQVEYKPLVLGKKIKLGREVEKEIKWDEKIVSGVKVGDWVSFHWTCACEVLDAKEVKNLEYYTQKTINLVNAPNR
jgi:hydrogenase maturation factor